MSDRLCTCPVPGEFQIHHPRCGDPSWDAEDADTRSEGRKSDEAPRVHRDAVRSLTADRDGSEGVLRVNDADGIPDLWERNRQAFIDEIAKAATEPRLVGGLAAGAQRARGKFNEGRGAR